MRQTGGTAVGEISTRSRPFCFAIAETMPRQEGNQMHVILGQRAGRKNAPKAVRQESAEEAPVEEGT